MSTFAAVPRRSENTRNDSIRTFSVPPFGVNGGEKRREERKELFLGVNLLIGSENGLMLLDRSGEGKVYSLIKGRRFEQLNVLESQNILLTISGKRKKIRLYYLSFLKNKIVKSEPTDGKRPAFTNVGELQGAKHFKIGSFISSMMKLKKKKSLSLVKYERIKFLIVALEDSIEVYAWAPKPYHKFMTFKVNLCLCSVR